MEVLFVIRSFVENSYIVKQNDEFYLIQKDDNNNLDIKKIGDDFDLMHFADFAPLEDADRIDNAIAQKYQKELDEYIATNPKGMYRRRDKEEWETETTLI